MRKVVALFDPYLLIHPLGIFTSLSHHSSLSQIVTVLICTLAQMYIP